MSASVDSRRPLVETDGDMFRVVKLDHIALQYLQQIGSLKHVRNLNNKTNSER